MEAANEHAYLALRPDSPLQTCDVSLRLDDGTILPAHWRVLAQYSPVFKDMFDLGDDEPVSAAKPATTEELPFSGCPREVATGLLSLLYSAPSMSGASLLSKRLLLSIARLGDKFDMKEIVELCDKSITKWESSRTSQEDVSLSDGCPAKDRSPPPAHKVLMDLLQGLPPDLDNLADIMQAAVAHSQFYDLEEVMQTAADIGMPKLLACCERSAARKGAFGQGNLPASSGPRVMKAFLRAQDAWNMCLRINHGDQDPGRFGHPWCEWTDHIPSAQEFAEWAAAGEG